MTTLLRLGALCLALLLGACTSQKVPDPTRLDLTLNGGEDLNPDLNGRPSPLVVRLIELKNPVGFENADFFPLYDNAKQALAPDWVAEEEIELRPGETRELKLRLQGDSRYVGIYGAYRNLGESQWRQVIQLKPNALAQVRLQLSAEGIQATPAAKE
ncbi:type VI secretion system lipoprotein TssJ [Pseudomonas oryzihabitans]|uniref:Type VI secretion system protein VasD n=1 Tax=Pseudomonas oryzihabitans TaxID=47885 RepID=A0AAJ2BKG8_9PSED|nr:type VI secretion system lipoprotein TssJ [Pseudomonas psychrotolerans]MDR6234515.1 type VI secretion system protein VasD [Pseudomonas psychrotolerans]MDR6356345.1 type VI secretion system protein VasD [Pseudomonas psychrotolerans]